jgi:hypothetical protein
MCLSSRSLASSVVRPDRRSSSCCCEATSFSYLAAAAWVLFSRSAIAVDWACSSFSRRSAVESLSCNEDSWRRSFCSASLSCCAFSRDTRSASVRSSCAFSLTSSSASFLRVSASRSASLMMRSACSSARPIVSAAMRFLLATQ